MSPRPILKRTPSAAPQTHHPHAVHFPPSPALTRTFSALSAAQYDRSPIVVAPNSCALPERGCPGRTYTLEEQAEHASLYAPVPLPASSRALHPRALNRVHHAQPSAYPPSQPPQLVQGVTPGLAMPPLIPDLSSESDESDGFTSPPPSAIYPPPTRNPPLKGYPGPTPPVAGGLVYDEYVSFLPHPPSPHAAHAHAYTHHASPPPPASHQHHSNNHPPSPPTDEQRARRRRERERKRDRSRERDRIREEAEEYDADDATVVSSSPKLSSSPRSTRRSSSRSSSSGYAGLCRSFTGFGVEDHDSGCLGGF